MSWSVPTFIFFPAPHARACAHCRALQKANCYHKEGHDAPCSVGGDVYYMLLFGLAQVVLSQIPDFHEMAGLSIFAAVMSFTYALVGVGLGVAKVIGNIYAATPRSPLICMLCQAPAIF
jgi:hypothetical protein